MSSRTRPSTAAVVIALALAGNVAHADAPFAHRPGPTVSVAAQFGLNRDDAAVDFTGAQPYLTLEAGYRLPWGTEALVTGGAGLGGHEGLLVTYGAGVRQRVHLAGVEPYVEGGLFFVGDEASTPMALGLGAGVELRVADDLAVGLGGGHYVSDDEAGPGALDWYGRVNLRWDLGARARR